MNTWHATVADMLSNLFQELVKIEFLKSRLVFMASVSFYCLLYVLLVVEKEKSLTLALTAIFL